MSTFCSPGITSQACCPPGSMEQEHACFSLPLRKSRTRALGVLSERDHRPHPRAWPSSLPEQGVSEAGSLLPSFHTVCFCFFVPAAPVPQHHLMNLVITPTPIPGLLVPRLLFTGVCLSNTPALSSLYQPPSVTPTAFQQNPPFPWPMGLE